MHDVTKQIFPTSTKSEYLNVLFVRYWLIGVLTPMQLKITQSAEVMYSYPSCLYLTAIVSFQLPMASSLRSPNFYQPRNSSLYSGPSQVHNSSQKHYLGTVGYMEQHASVGLSIFWAHLL